MFHGFFVQALNQSFNQLFAHWGRGPAISREEGRVYGDHGRMYLMGCMSSVYEPDRG